MLEQKLRAFSREEKVVVQLGNFLLEDQLTEGFDVSGFDELDEAELVQIVEMDLDFIDFLAEIFRQILGAHALGEKLTALGQERVEFGAEIRNGLLELENIKQFRAKNGTILGLLFIDAHGKMHDQFADRESLVDRDDRLRRELKCAFAGFHHKAEFGDDLRRGSKKIIADVETVGPRLGHVQLHRMIFHRVEKAQATGPASDQEQNFW